MGGLVGLQKLITVLGIFYPKRFWVYFIGLGFRV